MRIISPCRSDTLVGCHATQKGLEGMASVYKPFLTASAGKETRQHKDESLELSFSSHSAAVTRAA